MLFLNLTRLAFVQVVGFFKNQFSMLLDGGSTEAFKIHEGRVNDDTVGSL